MLPRHCNLDLLASREEHLRGTLPVDGLHRLVQAVDHTAGPVRVNLKFGHHATGLVRVDGRLEVPVRLTCQRCLESFETGLDASVDVLVARNDTEAEGKDRGCEVIRIEDDMLAVWDFVEDELLLSLPMYASHPPEQCAPPASCASRDGHSDTAPGGPLAQLAQIIHSSST